MNIRLVKFAVGVLLVAILLSHNFIFNLPQALQDNIMELHKKDITEFNLLYSLQTLPIIFLIIPLGVLYDTFGPKMLIPAAGLLFFGQVIMYIYAPLQSSFSFIMMIMGRVMQGIGAQILYMGQGVLATRWMGNMVGLILVLPEVGEMLNAYLTPILSNRFGIRMPMGIGVGVCLLSFVCSIVLWRIDSKYERASQSPEELTLVQPSEEINCSKIKHFSRLFWILIGICAIDQSIYMPFLDNANSMIISRFGIQYVDTGKFICIPFLSAIFSTMLFGCLLKFTNRKKLAMLSGILGVLAHLFIWSLPNSQSQSHLLIAISFCIFGLGLGSYYAVIYSMIGLAVKKQHAGTGYAVVSFTQALGMSVFPELSAIIINRQPNKAIGYSNSSLLYIGAAMVGLVGCVYLYWQNSSILTHVGYEQEKDVIYMTGGVETSYQNRGPGSDGIGSSRESEIIQEKPTIPNTDSVQ